MRFLRRLRCLEYSQLPLIAHATPLSCSYKEGLLRWKDNQVGFIVQFCNNSINSPGVRYGNCSFSTMLQSRYPDQCSPREMALSEHSNQYLKSSNDTGGVSRRQIGENVSRKDKMKFLVNTLLDLKDSKDAVYGALDAWVAWEQNFPIASLKRALVVLEEQHQYHRVIQVIKWMLSKGQGTTMGTYHQLINALDMDHRAEEAHRFWVKRIGHDLHSVPWQLCRCMISIYYKNNMQERLVKLFKGLEAFDRKPPHKSVVQNVANAYEMLGFVEEKERVLEKYSSLFKSAESFQKKPKKSALLTSKMNNSKRQQPPHQKLTSSQSQLTIAQSGISPQQWPLSCGEGMADDEGIPDHRTKVNDDAPTI